MTMINSSSGSFYLHLAATYHQQVCVCVCVPSQADRSDNKLHFGPHLWRRLPSSQSLSNQRKQRKKFVFQNSIHKCEPLFLRLTNRRLATATWDDFRQPVCLSGWPSRRASRKDDMRKKKRQPNLAQAKLGRVVAVNFSWQSSSCLTRRTCRCFDYLRWPTINDRPKVSQKQWPDPTRRRQLWLMNSTGGPDGTHNDDSHPTPKGNFTIQVDWRHQLKQAG